jgi:LPXTG-motif cell wall-anchored protein
VKAPQGYVLANSTTFETIDEHNTKITIVNGKYSVSLVDSQEETIEGAKFQLLDEEGNILEEWVSTEDVYIPDSLTVGKTYTIVETYTPTGFNQMQPYTFTVANENEAIVLKNNCTSIYKKTSTGKAVVGAALQIQDEEGNVIDSWLSGQQVVSLEDSVVKEANEKGIAYIVKPDISENSTEETIPSDEDLAIIIMQKVKPTTTENTYVLITEYSDGNWTYQEVDSKGIELGHRANLISDTNYELVETKAPDGFELASNMSFIAKADTDYSVTMIDEYKVEAAIHKLATGIHSNITYIAVGFAAIVILVVIFVLRKKKHTATN